MREMNNHKCPVCGYKQLSQPPRADTICPCCGTHFGYHDYATTHEELRARWISKGAPWFSRARQQPADWDPMVQLWESGFGFQNGAPDEIETISEYDVESLDFAQATKVTRTALTNN